MKNLHHLLVRAVLVVSLLAASVSAYAQNVATGSVKDAIGPVIGASIAIQGTLNGTITDMDGNFSLSGVKSGDVLEVSCIGYTTQHITWNGQELDIVLVEDRELLEATVVTALGIKRSTKALGYSVTEVKGEDLSHNVISPVSALQGKIAGVDISGSDGGLFGSSKILIRGASTLGKNNQPIYVVDGVILDNAIKDGDGDWTDTDRDWGNELKNLNPDDFETVAVLKGASATALYGSRGLNGAVVITTKSGKGSRGLGINFSQTLGLDYVYAGPDLQNLYGEGGPSGLKSGEQWNWNEFALNSKGVPSYPALSAWGDMGTSFGPKFDGRDIENFDYTMTKYNAYKNNFREAYDLGFSTNTNVSVQGGTDKTTFYTSLSYKYAEGTSPNNSFSRLSFLAKASHKITDMVELEASMSFSNSNPKNPEVNLGENFFSGTWGRYYDSKYWRTRYKGEHGGLASTAYGDEYGYAPGKGTWWGIYENSYEQKETMVRPTLKLTTQLTPWLKWVTEGNYNYYYRRNETKELGNGYANEGGYYSMGLYTKEQTNLNTNLMFNQDFGTDWNVNGFLRGEYYHNFAQAMSENTNGGLVVPGKFFLGNSKEQIGASGSIQGEKTIYSVAGQIAASWRNQIFVDVTGRNDWSSALVYADGHGNFSYFYPSVNGSWLISETFKDQLPSWMSFLKIRGSWAQVGNDTDAYSINSAYGLVSTVTNGNGTFGLEIPTKAYDQNLRPERKNSWEVGLDWRVFNNRIGLDATYYKENTKDQIMTIDVPSVSGISQQVVNAGNIQNQGVEIALNTIPVETKDFTWDLNFTYTKNMSKIVSLHENVADFITLGGMAAYGNYRIASVAKVGGSYGLLVSDSKPKLDEKTGLPILRTSYYNGYHGLAYTRTGDVQEIGDMQPKFLGSINTSLRYKNFTLRAQLDGRFGGYVASYNSRYGTAYGYTESSLQGRDTEHGGIAYTSMWDGKSYTDGVIPEGIIVGGTTLNTPTGSYTVADGGETYQALVDKGVAEPIHASSWHYFANSWGQGVVNDDWVSELTYIALREVSISYRVPERFASKIHSKGMSISASGRNLGYLYNSLPNHFNPESIRGTSASQYEIRSAAPYTASFFLTLNLTF